MRRNKIWKRDLSLMAHATINALLRGSMVSDGATAGLLFDRWGDALRLGEGRIARIEKRVNFSDWKLIADAASLRANEVKGWTLPSAGDPCAIDALSHAVARRDETESMLDAISRSALDRHKLLVNVPGVDELFAELDTFDAALGRLASTKQIECALGQRIVLQDEWPWYLHI